MRAHVPKSSHHTTELFEHLTRRCSCDPEVTLPGTVVLMADFDNGEFMRRPGRESKPKGAVILRANGWRVTFCCVGQKQQFLVMVSKWPFHWCLTVPHRDKITVSATSKTEQSLVRVCQMQDWLSEPPNPSDLTSPECLAEQFYSNKVRERSVIVAGID